MPGILTWFNKEKQENSSSGAIRHLDKDGSNVLVGSNELRQGFRVSACQSSGKERSQNEDAIFIYQSAFLRCENPFSTGLFLVADGMGGHQQGEEASRLASQGAGRFLLENLLPVLFEDELPPEDAVKGWVTEAVRKAQELVLTQVPGSGTTLTLALAIGDDLVTAHVGDSRLYLLRPEGQLILKTKDHSLVNRLVELGEISHSEADQHPQRNVLYRALGQSDDLQPDICVIPFEKGDRILICSDGLWGVLADSLIEEMVNDIDDFDKIASELVSAANDAGGPDNISVILVEKLV